MQFGITIWNYIQKRYVKAGISYEMLENITYINNGLMLFYYRKYVYFTYAGLKTASRYSKFSLKEMMEKGVLAAFLITLNLPFGVHPTTVTYSSYCQQSSWNPSYFLVSACPLTLP